MQSCFSLNSYYDAEIKVLMYVRIDTADAVALLQNNKLTYVGACTYIIIYSRQEAVFNRHYPESGPHAILYGAR